MFEGKTIAVVIPCFNEEARIGKVLETVPEFVDTVIAVDDGSVDGTAAAVNAHIAAEAEPKRTVLLSREANGGAGAAIVSGFQECLRRDIDVVAVMDADGQMAPQELPWLVGPVARDEVDYAKGNRLFYRGAWQRIPRARFLGNAFLSMLTKIASGYWHVADSQSGYLVLARRVLETIDLRALHKGFGYTNDLLVQLNIYDFRVADVRVRPIYEADRQSRMRPWKALPGLCWLVMMRFWSRMWQKYVIRDFHPLVMFYVSATILALAAAGLFVRLVWLWIAMGAIPRVNALVWVLCSISAIQFGLFAMWFDMEDNRDLNVTSRQHSAPKATDKDRPFQGGSTLT